MMERPRSLKPWGGTPGPSGPTWRTVVSLVVLVAVLALMLEGWWILTVPEGLRANARVIEIPAHKGLIEVAAIGRNNRTGLQVWSSQHCYPGEARYREFHKRDGVSGLHYWRVTGPEVDLGDKQVYDPDAARDVRERHSGHFCDVVRSDGVTAGMGNIRQDAARPQLTNGGVR